MLQYQLYSENHTVVQVKYIMRSASASNSGTIESIQYDSQHREIQSQVTLWYH